MASPTAIQVISRPSFTFTPRPSSTFTPQPSASSPPASPSPTATPAPTLQVCSPLEGIPLSQLSEVVVNPFHPPPAGSDDPHQGVDLAELGPGRVALAGLPVHAVLNGRVSTVIADRFPYGNAIFVETPLEDLPEVWQEAMSLPTPAPTLAVIPALTCPEISQEPAWDLQNRSLYVLYAHLQQPPVFQPGDTLGCGDVLGTIGNTGNALNPHLHLEVRLGPGGVSFTSLAHYDVSATLEEMHDYCLWRVSGLFQLIDPFSLLSLGE